jgi:hypothetical protein
MTARYPVAILLGMIFALAGAEEKRPRDASLLTLSGHERWVSSVAFSPDGKRIVSGSEDDTLKVWDASTGKELMTLRVGEGRHLPRDQPGRKTGRFGGLERCAEGLGPGQRQGAAGPARAQGECHLRGVQSGRQADRHGEWG